MPKVSIIIPVYNKEKYIEEVFSNMLNQDFQDWELIVVDDGSIDDSLNRIRKFESKDKRIKVIVQENQGVSSARNRGIAEAQGEWIWFVDADDNPSKTFLKDALNSLSTNLVADIVVGNYVRKETDGTKNEVTINENGFFLNEAVALLFMKYQYENGYFGYLWNKLIRTSVIKEKNIAFKVGLTLAEDLGFMIEIYKQAKGIIFIPTIAMEYTVGAENSSADKEIDYYEQLLIQLKVYNWILKERQLTKYESFLKNKISYYVAFVIFYGFDRNENYKLKAKEFMNDDLITQIISVDGVDAVMKPIVKCILTKNMNRLIFYLNFRKNVRLIYRILMRRGKE